MKWQRRQSHIGIKSKRKVVVRRRLEDDIWYSESHTCNGKKSWTQGEPKLSACGKWYVASVSYCSAFLSYSRCASSRLPAMRPNSLSNTLQRPSILFLLPSLGLCPSDVRPPLRTSSRDSNSRQDQRRDQRTGRRRHRCLSAAAVGTCPVAVVLAGSTFAAGAGIGLGAARSPGLAEASRSSEAALGCSSPAGRRRTSAGGMRVAVRPVRCC